MSNRLNFLALILITLSLVVLSGCPGTAEDACGMSGAVPTTDDVGSGRVVADLDGTAFSEAGTWRPPPGGSFTAGQLDVIIQNDENGDDTADLITEGAFPICIPIGDRSETSGQANFVEGGFVSDDDTPGMFSILAEEDGEIVGRFAFTLGNSAGDAMNFSEGMFRVPQR